MYRDLTKVPIGPGLVRFALPMMLGNLLQQIYNLADTLIAGRALGRDALAAIGSAYTLMTFLTSIFIGRSLEAGALFSIYFGKREQEKLQSAVGHGMVLVLGVTLVLTAASYAGLDVILRFLQVPSSLRAACGAIFWSYLPGCWRRRRLFSSALGQGKSSIKTGACAFESARSCFC